MNGTFVIGLLIGMVLGRVGFSLVALRMYDERFFFFFFVAVYGRNFGGYWSLSHLFFFQNGVLNAFLNKGELKEKEKISGSEYHIWWGRKDTFYFRLLNMICI